MEKRLDKAITLSRLLFSIKIRRVSSMPIYITNRCNSRCRTCNIWKARDKVDIDKSLIVKLLSDKEIGKDVEFIMTGGEFLLHPEYRKIVRLFKGRNIRVFSNGILAEELISLVKDDGVERVSLSLDGKPETNRFIRGVDTFKNIERIVVNLKSVANVEIEYTICKWNTREDLKFVLDFAKSYGVGISVGYFSTVEYFGMKEKQMSLYDVSDIMDSDYHSLYPLWADGKLKLPCFSTRIRPVIKPNGDVELCEVRSVGLGNLYEKEFGEIWRSKRTEELIRSSQRCNGCWLNCQRKVDLALIYLPRRLGIRFR